MQRSDQQSENGKSVQMNNEVCNKSVSASSHMHYQKRNKSIKDGRKSTIENKFASQSDDLSQVFGEFQQNADDHHSSQKYNVNSQFHDDSNQFYPNLNNRKSIVNQSYQFKSQNQSSFSQQRSQFKDLLKDISPRNQDQELFNQILIDDDHFYNQQSRSISNDVRSQSNLENKRKSQEDRFSNQIQIYKNLNDKNGSCISQKEHCLQILNENKSQSRQRQSINEFNYKEQNKQLSYNQSQNQSEMDSRYKELLRYAQLNKILNANSQNNRQADDSRQKISHQRSLQSTSELCDDNGSNNQIINNQYRISQQKIMHPPFSEQHGRAKKLNNINSEYGTVHHDNDFQNFQYQQDQTDSCTQNTLSAKFNDVCIQLQNRDESNINPIYFVQNNESLSQNTDVAHYENFNQQNFGNYDQIDSKYLQRNRSSKGNLQFLDDIYLNQNSIEIGQNIVQINIGTDPKTISSSQLSIAKQQRNLNYQQLIKSQYEDFNQEEESHFFSITDIQYQDAGQQPNQISKDKNLNERSKHQMLDVLYFSLNQNSEKSPKYEGQSNRNVNYVNPYSQQNTSSSANQTFNKGFLNQTSSTEQEYYRQKISQQLNMNLKSEFGKRLMDGQRKKQFSPFQDHYLHNEKNKKNEQQTFVNLQNKNKDFFKIYENQQSQNTVISHRTKSSNENRTENIFSSQNTHNIVTYRDKPSELNIQKHGSDVTSPNYLINSHINTQRIEQNDFDRSSSVENQSHQIYQLYLKTRNNNKQNSYQIQNSQHAADYRGDQKRKQEWQSNSINVVSRVTNPDVSDNIYFNTSNSPSQLANAAFNIRKDIDIRSYNQMSEIYEDTQKDDNFMKLQKITSHNDEVYPEDLECKSALSKKELILRLFKKNQFQNQSQQQNKQIFSKEQETYNSKSNSLLSQQIQYLNQKYRVSQHKFSDLIPQNGQKESIKGQKYITNNQRSSSADQQASRAHNVYQKSLDFDNQQKYFQKRASRNSQNIVNELETGQFKNIGETFKIDDSQVIEGLGKGIYNQHSSMDSKGTQRSSKISTLKQFENERKQSLKNTSNIERLRIVELNKMYLNENKAKFDLTLYQNTNKYKFESLQDSNYCNNVMQSQTLDSHQNSNFTLGDRNILQQQKEKHLSPYSSLECKNQKYIDPYQSQYYKNKEKPKINVLNDNSYASKYRHNLELDQKIQYEKYLKSKWNEHPQQQIFQQKNDQEQDLMKDKIHKRSQSYINSNDYILSDRNNFCENQLKIEINESNNLNSKRSVRASNNSLERPISNFYKNYILNKSTQNNFKEIKEQKSELLIDKQYKQQNEHPYEIPRKQIFENTIRSVTSNANYKNNQFQSSNNTNYSQIKESSFINRNFENELQKCKSEQELKKQQHNIQPKNKQMIDSSTIDRYQILKERQQQIDIQSKKLFSQNNLVQDDDNLKQKKKQIDVGAVDQKNSNKKKENEQQEQKRKVSPIQNMQLKSTFGLNQVINFKEETALINQQMQQTQVINLSQKNKKKRFELDPSLINFHGNLINSPKNDETSYQNYNVNEKEQTKENLKILTQSYDKKNELLRKKYLDFNIFANKTSSEIQTLEDKTEKKIQNNQNENDQTNQQATQRSQSDNSIFQQTQNLQQHTKNPYSYFQSQNSNSNIKILDQHQRQQVYQNISPNIFNFLSLLFGQNHYFKLLQNQQITQNMNTDEYEEDQKQMEFRNSYQAESQDTYFDQRCMTPKLSEYMKQEEEYEKQKLELYDQLYNHCQISQTTGKCSHSQSFNSSMKNRKEFINILNQNHNSSSLLQSSMVECDNLILKPKENFIHQQSLQLSQNTHNQMTQQNSSNQFLQVPCQNQNPQKDIIIEEKVNLEQIWNQINPKSSSKKLRDLMSLQYEQAQMLIDLQTQFLQVQQIEDGYKQNIDNISSKQNDIGSIGSFQNTYRPISTLNKSKREQNSIQNQVTNYRNGNSNFDLIDEAQKFDGANIKSQEQINQTMSVKSKSKYENNSRKQNTEKQSKQNSVSSHKIISEKSKALSKNQLSQISSQKQSTFDLIKKIYKQMEKIDQKIQLKEKIDQDQMNKMWRVIRKFKQIFKKLKQQNGVLCVQAVNQSSVSNSDASSIQEDFQNQENNSNATNQMSINSSPKQINQNQTLSKQYKINSQQKAQYNQLKENYSQSGIQEQLSHSNDLDIYRVAHLKNMLCEQPFVENENNQMPLNSQREKQLSAQNELSLAQSQQIELSNRQFLANDFNQQFPSKKDQQSQPISNQSSFRESSLKHTNTQNDQIQFQQPINMDQTALSQIILNQSSCCTNIQKNQYFQKMSLEQLQNQKLLNLASQKNTEAQDFEMKIESKQYGKESNFLTQQQNFVREIDFEINKNINQSSGTASLNSKDSMFFQKQPYVEIAENIESQILINIQTRTNQNHQQQSVSETLNLSQHPSKRINRENMTKSEPYFDEQIKKAGGQMVFECNDHSSKELTNHEENIMQNLKVQEMILATSNSNSTHQIGRQKDQSQTIKSSLSLVDTEKYIQTVKQLNHAVQQKQKLVEKLQRIKDKIKKAKNIKNIYKLQSQRSQIEQQLNQKSLNSAENSEKQEFQDKDHESAKKDFKQQQFEIINIVEQSKTDQIESIQNTNEMKSNSFIDCSLNQFEQICNMRQGSQQNRSKSLNQYEKEYQNKILLHSDQQFKIEKKLNFDVYKNDFKNIFLNKKLDEKENLNNDYSLYTYSQQKIMQNSRRGIFQKIIDLQKLRNQRESSNQNKSSLSPNNIITPSVVNLNNDQNAFIQNNNSFQSSFNNTVALKNYAISSNQKNLHAQINEKSHLQTQKLNNSVEKQYSNIGSGLSGQIFEKQNQYQRQAEFTPSQTSNLKVYSEKNQIASMQLSSNFAKKMLDQQNVNNDIYIPKKLDYYNNDELLNQNQQLIENRNILVIDQQDLNIQNNSQDIEAYSKQASHYYKHQLRHTQSSQEFPKIQSHSFQDYKQSDEVKSKLSKKANQDILYRQQEIKPMIMNQQNNNVKVLDSQPYTSPAYRREQMLMREYERNQSQYDQFVKSDKDQGKQSNKSSKRQKSDILCYKKTIFDDQSAKHFIKNVNNNQHLQTRSFEQ